MNTFTEKHVAYIIERLLGYIPAHYDFNNQHLDPISEIYTENLLKSPMKDLIKYMNEPNHTYDDFTYFLKDPDTLQLIFQLLFDINDFYVTKEEFKRQVEKITGLEVFSIKFLDSDEIVIELISPKITELSDKCYNKLLNELNNMQSPTINDRYWREAVQYVRENL